MRAVNSLLISLPRVSRAPCGRWPTGTRTRRKVRLLAKHGAGSLYVCRLLLSFSPPCHAGRSLREAAAQPQETGQHVCAHIKTNALTRARRNAPPLAMPGVRGVGGGGAGTGAGTPSSGSGTDKTPGSQMGADWEEMRRNPRHSILDEVRGSRCGEQARRSKASRAVPASADASQRQPLQ